MRKTPLFSAAWLLLALPAQSAPAPSWIVSCDVGAPAQAGSSAAVRVFRLGPGLLQEWRADRREFGPNLCLSFPCRSDQGRMEGRIESRSVIFMLKVDPNKQTAAWRTQGATGNPRTNGACTVRAEGPGAKAPPA